MASMHYLVVGNPGVGKSFILNGLAGKHLFQSGVNWGGGLTQVLQREEIPGRGIFMDTPGLDDDTLREKAAEEISKALKETGTFRIFFVCMLHAGRVLPADRTTMMLVCNACRDIPEFTYSIIFNKLTEFELDCLMNNTNNAMDKVMSTIMPDMPVKTTSIHYILSSKDYEIADPSKAMEYTLPDDLIGFVFRAPHVHIEADNVHDIEIKHWEEELSKAKAHIELMASSLEETQKANAALRDEMIASAELNAEKQAEADEAMKKLKAELDGLEKDHQQKIAALEKEAKENQELFEQKLKKFEDTKEQMQKEFEKAQDDMKAAAKLNEEKQAEADKAQQKMAQMQAQMQAELEKNHQQALSGLENDMKKQAELFEQQLKESKITKEQMQKEHSYASASIGNSGGMGMFGVLEEIPKVVNAIKGVGKLFGF